MIDPFVSQYVEIRNLGHGNFTITAKSHIAENTIVEICPVAVITKRDSILLTKAIPSIRDAIVIDEEILNREYQLFAQLGELELEKRLDAGEISSTDYVRILRSKINMNTLLDSKSHVLLLGNGILYRISDSPNLICEYHSQDKVCIFKTVCAVQTGTELTYFKQK
jgi:hypothetical protein